MLPFFKHYCHGRFVVVSVNLVGTCGHICLASYGLDVTTVHRFRHYRNRSYCSLATSVLGVGPSDRDCGIGSIRVNRHAVSYAQ